MDAQLYCPNEARKALVRGGGKLNGIDWLEVLDHDAPAGSPRQQTLLVHCLLPAAGLTRANVRIEGGVRVGPVNVQWAYPAKTVPAGLLNAAETAYLADLTKLSDPGRVLVVRTDSRGDFSTYTLRLVLSPTQPALPPAGFDAILSSTDFSFKVECPSRFDCGSKRPCPEPAAPAPPIDYLTKDYAGFRRQMLDRLSLLMPDWQERNPADVGIAVVEVLAYAADHLSYYQDAVATEAYLGTARRRVSVRRHARLVDYALHDGCNARCWVCLDADRDLIGTSIQPILPAGTLVLSQGVAEGAAVPLNGLDAVLAADPIVFETLHALTRLKVKRNAIPFGTWGDPHCCLPRGATSATLLGSAAELELSAGDVLIFEEVLGAESGLPEDADPSHRHAVRLTEAPQEMTDEMMRTKVLSIRWDAADALPFPLCLWQFDDGAGGVRHTSLARGNVVLADHGLTAASEELLSPQTPEQGPYRPHLRSARLTHAVLYDDARARKQPAAAALAVNPRQAVPEVALRAAGENWLPRRDLFDSDRFDAHFVVEMEDDGRASLRFGDDTLGRSPIAGTHFSATPRVGNGSAGNLGPEALVRVVTDVAGIVKVRNPLPAAGGADPERVEEVRLYAPQAFRRQERAVTEADYAAAAERHPDVQRAVATRRWTGSWYTMFLIVDRKGGRPVDRAFDDELTGFLERFRLAGYDLEIESPRFVPLDLALHVCAAPGYFAADVERALLDVFASVDLPDGRRGFFHPDRFTFGQPVFLSQIIAAAMRVPGVASVQPTIFQRFGHEAHGELAEGRITLGRLEIVRLDNDPSQPENGRIVFDVGGGL